MKIAIVHYWLTNKGGGERVLLELHKLYPEAPIFTSVFDAATFPELRDADVRTTWLQRFPFRFRHQFFALLRPWAFRSLDLSEFDVIISSDAADAKNVRVAEDAVHICYCHTPPRYYWSHYENFIKNPGFGIFDPFARIGLKLLVGVLRRTDLKAAQAVDYFIANSNTVRNRIKKYYRKNASVIYPPVDIQRFTPKTRPVKKHGFVHVGRMVPMKRIDLIIQACNQLKLPLTVAGRGNEYGHLRSLAGPTVKVINSPSDDEVVRLLQRAEALIFAAEEDFGIVPVEAMAAGTPVLAYGKAGSAETVVSGKTGDFFDEQSTKSLVAALKQFEPKTYNSQDLFQQAAQFSGEEFDKQIQEFVDSARSRSSAGDS